MFALPHRCKGLSSEDFVVLLRNMFLGDVDPSVLIIFLAGETTFRSLELIISTS